MKEQNAQLAAAASARWTAEEALGHPWLEASRMQPKESARGGGGGGRV